MKVLVTGGAGYIGSITVEQLVTAGEEVVVFDDLSQGHRSAVHPGAAFEAGDLADRDAVERVMTRYAPEAVLHFASRTLVGESMVEPFAYLGDNVTNGLNLLRSAVDHGVERFVLSSTANLFGSPACVPIDEAQPILPGSPYGESKWILERVLHWLDRTRGLRSATLRYFNAAGCSEERGEDHDPETHLIPLVLEVALERRPSVTIFGDDYETPDGTCVRDYVHVVDLAQAHLLALAGLERGSCAYNLGNGRGFSVREVIETARKVTGRPIPVEVGRRRPGDPATLVAASDAIRRDLGWKPKLDSLEAIVESAWRWHREHPDGYPD